MCVPIEQQSRLPLLQRMLLLIQSGLTLPRWIGEEIQAIILFLCSYVTGQADFGLLGKIAQDIIGVSPQQAIRGNSAPGGYTSFQEDGQGSMFVLLKALVSVFSRTFSVTLVTA